VALSLLFLPVATYKLKQSHYNPLNDLYSLLNIVRVVKSRRMRWAGHVARMREEREGCTECWWGNRRERGRWGDPDVDGKIIYKMDLQECGGVRGDWMELGQDRDG
jgi:hypothetical protein